jgi:hypothetical protein
VSRIWPCALVTLLSMTVAGCHQPQSNLIVDKQPPDQVEKAPPTEDKYRAWFASQPRHLFGCGVIWADWRWPGDKSKWESDAQCMDLIKAMGGTSVPINIPWHDVEPQPGQWYWDYVDHQVAEAEKRGLAMFAYMGLTPDWALPPEAPANQPGIGFRFPPPDDRREQFVEYCHRVAERYKGRVQYYQFWNEQNGCSWVNDGCSNGRSYALYARWLKIWYAAMKEVDPECVLGIGGLDYHEGVPGHLYLEGLYAEGAKDSFDAINIHPYGITTPLYLKAVEDTRRVMLAHGDGHKGIWIREYGWSIKDEDEKAWRLIKTLETLSGPEYYYVTMATYLGLTDVSRHDDFGLCDRDLKPRKSYLAFQSFARRSSGGK